MITARGDRQTDPFLVKKRSRSRPGGWGSITGILLASGSEERITWLDLELAKNAKDLHSNQQCMTSYSIFSRYIDYCVMYPVIRYRANKKSQKIELFM